MLLFTRNYRGATIRRLLARVVDVRLNEPGKIGWPRIISRAVRVPLILIDRADECWILVAGKGSF